MEICLGADHRGYALKNRLKTVLIGMDCEVKDAGPLKYDPEDDYNVAAKAVCRWVAEAPAFRRGILICGSAHGMTMQANRFPTIRAANCATPELVQLAREHNDCNVLCLPADFVQPEDLATMLKIFLTTPALTGEKYARRAAALDADLAPYLTAPEPPKRLAGPAVNPRLAARIKRLTKKGEK